MAWYWYHTIGVIDMNKQTRLFVGKLLLLIFFMLTISGYATAQYEKLARNIEIEKPPGIKVLEA